MLCLQRGAEKPAGTVRTAAGEKEEGGGDRLLVCAVCQQPVTTAGARISVGGSHEHTCTNPHGVRFRIGCFAAATGCATVGASSTYWTWFPGFSWQIEECARCGAHLGWVFRSADSLFHGFILDRLVEVEDGP